MREPNNVEQAHHGIGMCFQTAIGVDMFHVKAFLFECSRNE